MPFHYVRAKRVLTIKLIVGLLLNQNSNRKSKSKMFSGRHGGSFHNASFDEQSADLQHQFIDNGYADEVIKYRTKVADVLNHADSISVNELKTLDDLSPYRDWFIKLVKYTDKLQSRVDSDFIQGFS